MALQITVCINTKNRTDKLTACLKSIQRSTYKKYHILVIDQSNQFEPIAQQKNITHVRSQTVGVGAAKNEALHLSTGDIVAFTDDDCVVSRLWLSNIASAFSDYPKIAAVFGKTKPYQPKKHPGMICPSIFSVTKARIINTPSFHATHIGYGNNMAIKKSILEDLGGFKPWLGPGSMGDNAEDAEMAARLLLNGHTLLSTPNILVYHNRWLTPKQMQAQTLSYLCGEMACYGYYAFKGHAFAKKVIRKNIIVSWDKSKDLIKKLIKGHLSMNDVINYFMALFSIIKGLSVAYWHL